MIQKITHVLENCATDLNFSELKVQLIHKYPD